MKKIVLGAFVALFLVGCAAPINGVRYDATPDVFIHCGNFHPVYKYPNGKPFIIDRDKHGYKHHKDLKCIKYKKNKHD